MGFLKEIVSLDRSFFFFFLVIFLNGFGTEMEKIVLVTLHLSYSEQFCA